jgi:hypothetical protein
MNTITRAKLVIAAVGLLVFTYGMRSDLDVVRWVGIAFVAAAFLLRFWPQARQPEREEDTHVQE